MHDLYKPEWLVAAICVIVVQPDLALHTVERAVPRRALQLELSSLVDRVRRLESRRSRPMLTDLSYFDSFPLLGHTGSPLRISS